MDSLPQGDKTADPNLDLLQLEKPSKADKPAESVRLHFKVLRPEPVVGSHGQLGHGHGTGRKEGKRPFCLYSRNNVAVLDRIMASIAAQTAIGLATVFDKRSAAVGLPNLSYIVVATDSPIMTYVFDCVSLDPIQILARLQAVLESAHIVKAVHNVFPCLSYLYQRHFLELDCVIDLQVLDATLRKQDSSDEEGKVDSVSLEELIQVYVDPAFAWPLEQQVAVGESSWNDQAVDEDVPAAAAAMEGAFLLDVFCAQQQVLIGSSVTKLGPEARKKLANMRRSSNGASGGQQQTIVPNQ